MHTRFTVGQIYLNVAYCEITSSPRVKVGLDCDRDGESDTWLSDKLIKLGLYAL